MFLINRGNKTASPIQKQTFGELGLKERFDLQEWISSTPEILGERLLIIQKEFSGFDDTSERLDLLALDEKGNLVVIENKLDDSGRDVTWQSLKYVSYCAKLTKSEILKIYQDFLGDETKKSAEATIQEFYGVPTIDEITLNDGDQRIILVAANFRREVTSTVMWLLDHSVQIKCVKVTPYSHNGELFLDVEQIIPIKEIEDYLIGISNKKQENIRAAAKKLDREAFLSKLTSNGRLMFSELFKFADENGLFVRWGTSGFSLNMRLKESGDFLGLCFGYEPKSVFKQSIYTGFEGVVKKIKNGEEIVELYRQWISKNDFFTQVGSGIRHKNCKWMISEETKIEQMKSFTDLLSNVIKKVEEFQPESNESEEIS